MVVSLEQAQQQLPELIASLQPGDEAIITQEDIAIAHLVPVPKDKPRTQFGNCRGMLTIISDDDEHLKDFAEYMP